MYLPAKWVSMLITWMSTWKKIKNILIYSKHILYNWFFWELRCSWECYTKDVLMIYPLNKVLAPATALIKKKIKFFLIYKVIQMWVMLLLIMLLFTLSHGIVFSTGNSAPSMSKLYYQTAVLWTRISASNIQAIITKSCTLD